MSLSLNFLGPQSPSEETEDSEAQKAVNALVDALTSACPNPSRRWTTSKGGGWLLAQLLNWHRREAKSFWWRYFYLANELTGEERFEESDALAMLTFQESWPDPAPSGPLYHPPVQVPAPGTRDQSRQPAPRSETRRPVGTVFFLDDDQGVIDIRLGNGRPRSDRHVPGPFDFFGPGPKPESLQRLAPVGAGPRHGKPRRVPGGPRPAWASIAQVRWFIRWFRGTGTPDTRRDDGGRCPPDCLVLDESYLAIQGLRARARAPWAPR